MLIQPQCFTTPCDPFIIDTNRQMVPGTINGQYVDPRNNTSGTYGGVADETPVFSTSTNELDKFRLLFLLAGIAIGFYFLRGR